MAGLPSSAAAGEASEVGGGSVATPRGSRFTRGLAAVVVGSLLALSACSSDDTTAESDPATTEAEAGAVQRDAVVRVGMGLVQAGTGGFFLDPTLSVNDTNDALQYLIFGRLLRPTPDGSLELDLAERAEVVDPTTIEVDIRPDVTFQDGTPFDAAAVKAGLDRTIASGNAGLTPGFASLTAVEVTGANSVTLKVPDGSAASWYDTYLGAWQTTIVKPDTDFDRPIGAGPMRVTDYVADQTLTLERYDEFWNADAVNFAGIEFVNVHAEQPQSGIAALASGQIDIVSTEVSQIPAVTGNLELLTVPDATKLVNMMVCKTDGPLADARVRQALNMAIDREAIGAAVFADTASPANQPWPEGHPFYSPEVADVLAYDPDGARELLAEAGYADGLTIDMYVVPWLSMPEASVVVEQQLADVGVTAKIISSPNFVNDYLLPQAAGTGLIPSIAPGQLRLQSWTGDAISNTCMYDSPELTTLSEELSKVSESSPEATEIWGQINEIVTSEALSVFIVFQSRISAYDSDVLVGPVTIWPRGEFAVPDVYDNSAVAKG
jgi:peptide/nickel transport system substrate-binding protein